jgi:hypothetical protein
MFATDGFRNPASKSDRLATIFFKWVAADDAEQVKDLPRLMIEIARRS